MQLGLEILVLKTVQFLNDLAKVFVSENKFLRR